jgi:hypothetical protein
LLSCFPCISYPITAAEDTTQPSSKRQKKTSPDGSGSDGELSLSDGEDTVHAAAAAGGGEDDLEALFEAQQQQEQQQRDASPADDELDAATLAALEKLRSRCVWGWLLFGQLRRDGDGFGAALLLQGAVTQWWLQQRWQGMFALCFTPYLPASCVAWWAASIQGV